MGVHAQVVLPLRSGLPRDVIVNTFTFGGIDASMSTADRNDLGAAIMGVYNIVAFSQPHPMAYYLSNALSRAANACQVKLYDITGHLDGSPHGSPFDVQPFQLGGAAGSDEGLPEQVALVATLEASGRAGQRVEVPDGADADAHPDRPRQRFTGRTYFGPWSQQGDVIIPDSNGLARSGLGLLVAQAVATLASNVSTNTPGYLGVWSRKDSKIREVDSVAYDDRWDTVRSRLPGPTSRARQAVAGAGTRVELAS